MMTLIKYHDDVIQTHTKKDFIDDDDDEDDSDDEDDDGDGDSGSSDGLIESSRVCGRLHHYCYTDLHCTTFNHTRHNHYKTRSQINHELLFQCVSTILTTCGMLKISIARCQIEPVAFHDVHHGRGDLFEMGQIWFFRLWRGLGFQNFLFVFPTFTGHSDLVHTIWGVLRESWRPDDSKKVKVFHAPMF